jgi:hypothetical protein
MRWWVAAAALAPHTHPHYARRTPLTLPPITHTATHRHIRAAPRDAAQARDVEALCLAGGESMFSGSYVLTGGGVCGGVRGV